MKAWLIYWIIGCAVVGLPLGGIMKECPNSEIRADVFLAAVAAWPVIIFSSFTRGKVDQPSKCPA